jgi:hypothetical protein
MTLTSTQFDELVSLYAEKLVDGMDLKTMEQFVYDTIVNNAECLSEEELLNEVANYFDDELPEMIKQVGADPDTIL